MIKKLVSVLLLVFAGVIVVYGASWIGVLVREWTAHWWFHRPIRGVIISCVPLPFIIAYGYIVGFCLFRVLRKYFVRPI